MEKSKIVEADIFVLRGKNSRGMAARLSNVLGFPELEMFDQRGACRMALTVDPTCGPAIRLFDQQGEGLAVLRIDAVNGGDEPALILIGKNGTEIELSPAAVRRARGGRDQVETGGQETSPRKAHNILVLPI